MSIELTALQQQRRDTAANWTGADPTLLNGELGYETDTGKFKIGDGSTAWTSLSYLPIPDSNGLIPIDQLLLPAGTAAAPSLTFTGDVDTGIYAPSANEFGVSTAGTAALTIDSSQRVGIGTASPTQLLQIEGDTPGITLRDTSTYVADTGPAIYLQGKDSNGSNTNFASIKGKSNTASNGHITFDTRTGGSMYERVRVTSDGKAGIGTTSPVSPLHVIGTDGTASVSLTGGSSTSSVTQINAVNEAGSVWNQLDIRAHEIAFDTASSERMRIDDEGIIYHNSSNHGIGTFLTASAGTVKYAFRGHHSTTAGNYSGTISFTVWSNGNVENTNDSYGQISDVKLKENIIDAPSQWDDFKAVRFRKYNFKKETGYETHTQLGVIAQELELTSPGLVYERPDQDADGNDLGTTTKAVKSSVLTKKALVALQEAMERIETLEQRLTDAGL